jgi:hypothetical protein
VQCLRFIKGNIIGYFLLGGKSMMNFSQRERIAKVLDKKFFSIYFSDFRSCTKLRSKLTNKIMKRIYHYLPDFKDGFSFEKIYLKKGPLKNFYNQADAYSRYLEENIKKFINKFLQNNQDIFSKNPDYSVYCVIYRRFGNFYNFDIIVTFKYEEK